MNTINGSVDLVPFAVALLVAVLFVVVAAEDAATSRVTVARAKAITFVAVGGLGAWGLVTTDWVALVQSLIATVLIVTIQLVPYLVQPGRSGEGTWIGRADVRLAVPFAWTLGWFGVGFAVVGFAAALLLGLLTGVVMRRRRIPFVPFLCAGLWVGLAWALARAVLGGG